MGKMDQDDIEAFLKGTTWKVYKYVLENGPTTIREIQKSLELSTPSLVLYHLNKLEQEGIIKKDEQGYTANIILLRNRVKVRKLLIPRYFFYSLFMLVAIIVQSSVFRPRIISRDYVFSLAVMFTITAFCLYETVRTFVNKSF
jgi:DNA-binding Lrp family transcriptional regulator